jgi:hypothetical protein
MPYLNGRYLVTRDGFVTVARTQRGSYPERALLPRWKDGSARYLVQIQGVQKQRRIVAIVAEVWGGEIAVSKDRAAHMRSVAMAHNEELTRRTRRERAKAKAKQTQKVSEIHMPPLTTECKFAEMDHFPPGIKTYDCPEMDPMSCGTWWVRIDMSDVKTKNKRKAA